MMHTFRAISDGIVWALGLVAPVAAESPAKKLASKWKPTPQPARQATN
jgi:hypothetical protein